MKIFRKIIIGLLTAAILLMAVFLAGRYGWKTLGFRACQGAGIESVSVSDHMVEIKGFYPGSFPEGFCGYCAEEQNGTLYVGFRFSAVFGFFETCPAFPGEMWFCTCAITCGSEEQEPHDSQSCNIYRDGFERKL